MDRDIATELPEYLSASSTWRRQDRRIGYDHAPQSECRWWIPGCRLTISHRYVCIDGRFEFAASRMKDALQASPEFAQCSNLPHRSRSDPESNIFLFFWE